MKIARLAVALLFSSLIVMATPSNCPGSPGSTLDSLNLAGGCFQVDVLFSSFAVTVDPSSLAAPTTADILMWGSGAAPNMDANFDTTGSVNQWSVPGSLAGGQINETLTYQANLQNLNDFVALSIDGSGTSVTGNGLVILTESFCVGAATTTNCTPGDGGSVTAVFFNGTLQSNSSPAVFQPTSSLLAISEQVQIFNIPGSPTTLNNLDNDFQEFVAPEPSTWLLLGTALTALGLLRRRVRG